MWMNFVTVAPNSSVVLACPMSVKISIVYRDARTFESRKLYPRIRLLGINPPLISAAPAIGSENYIVNSTMRIDSQLLLIGNLFLRRPWESWMQIFVLFLDREIDICARGSKQVDRIEALKLSDAQEIVNNCIYWWFIEASIYCTCQNVLKKSQINRCRRQV